MKKPATEKQLAFIRKLLTQKSLTEEYLNSSEALLTHGQLTVKHASDWIGALLQKPNLPSEISHQNQNQLPSVTPTPSITIQHPNFAHPIPPGFYALPTPEPTHTNDITFYEVWAPDDPQSPSHWAVFLLHGDESTKLDKRSALPALTAIATNPAEASMRYGKEVGRCGVCGRRLTNDESRERGIGPVCRSRNNW